MPLFRVAVSNEQCNWLVHCSGSEILDDDEDFYYTEVEETPSASSSTSSSPVLDVTSAADLARRDAAFSSPTAMDHDYQRKVCSQHQLIHLLC